MVDSQEVIGWEENYRVVGSDYEEKERCRMVGSSEGIERQLRRIGGRMYVSCFTAGRRDIGVVTPDSWARQFDRRV